MFCAQRRRLFWGPLVAFCFVSCFWGPAVALDLVARKVPSAPPRALKQQPENQPTTPNDMPPSAPQRRPFRPHFTYLYRLVLTRSRAAECRKANHFLAHLALLVGPEALSRPATAQNSLGRGRSPPCAPPCAAARRAAGLRPAEKLRLRRKIELRAVQDAPH